MKKSDTPPTHLNADRHPELSVVIATPDRFDSIAATIAHLQRQTARQRLEIVIVAPSIQELRPNASALDGFACFQVVEVGTVNSIGRANAAGVRAATAPLVALAEDHAFPDPDWAEALIAAHRQPWAVVGPVVRNANPVSAVSWADLLIGYGPWLEPAQAGEVDLLPGHNSSYKRALLLEYDAELERRMEAETVLHWELRAKGHRLYLEPAAKIAHINFARWHAWVPVQFHQGRVFAAGRARIENWSFWRRLVYTGGSPLIPLVRLARLMRQRHPVFWRVLPTLLCGLIIDGVGQGVGYALGAGNSKQRLAAYEFNRVRHNEP
jgi:hypothetical protein